MIVANVKPVLMNIITHDPIKRWQKGWVDKFKHAGVKGELLPPLEGSFLVYFSLHDVTDTLE